MNVAALHSHKPPPAAVARILARYKRREIEGFIEVAIGLLDVADGDPDLEPDDEDHEHDGREPNENIRG